MALDPERLQVDVSWVAAGKYTPVNYPSFVDSDPALSPPGQKTITNYVTVTVTYEWSPEIYFVGPFTLTSTSKVPVSY